MMLSGLVAGFGGPFYFIPMITRMQTVFRGAEIARVFRLRLAVMAGSMLLFNLAATPMFDLIGPTHTEFWFGLLLLALGIAAGSTSGAPRTARSPARLRVSPAAARAVSSRAGSTPLRRGSGNHFDLEGIGHESRPPVVEVERRGMIERAGMHQNRPIGRAPRRAIASFIRLRPTRSTMSA